MDLEELNTSEAALRELVESARQTASRLRWVPQPGPQLAALQSRADVLLFGGAAGAGKSNLLAGIATTIASNSLLVRREFSQAFSLVEELVKVAGTRANLNVQGGYFRLPGHTIRIGGCPNIGDELRYQGAARSFLGVDEAAAFDESQIRTLQAWGRPTPSDDPSAPLEHCRTILTSNPPLGSQGRWLESWFAARDARS